MFSKHKVFVVLEVREARFRATSECVSVTNVHDDDNVWALKRQVNARSSGKCVLVSSV